MRKVVRFSDKDRDDLFLATAGKIGIRPEAVEKDFWVCFMLDHLFHSCSFKEAFVFKGGTSLSKSYHLIDRFSEDIDLILDWRRVISDESDPWEDRSKNKQDQYNKSLNAKAAAFYAGELVPVLNSELRSILGLDGLVSIDVQDDMVINFSYPRLLEDDYIRPVIRLEIGPLAEWTPSHITTVSPFAAEAYPSLFVQPRTEVLTVDAERTFWEKITILHKIANIPEGKTLPKRYARHLYDVYCMGHSPVKWKAFEKKDLLSRDVLFKKKFYYSKGASYETATLNDICLIPGDRILSELRKDYKAMENMIYGEIPAFDEIIEYLTSLEEEIHSL